VATPLTSISIVIMVSSVSLAKAILAGCTKPLWQLPKTPNRAPQLGLGFRYLIFHAALDMVKFAEHYPNKHVFAWCLFPVVGTVV
jgi:hypothetical protein